MGVIAVVCSYSAITDRQKEYYVLLLLLQTFMIGTFCCLDLFLFYVFWEVMLVPMYFLIGDLGRAAPPLRGDQVLPLHAGGLGADAARHHRALLLQHDGLPRVQGPRQPADLLDREADGGRRRACRPELQIWLFFAFFLGFAIKVPMFPFHTWLPDAHTEAPTAGSVILAAILLKMGTYGFVRFSLPMFPEAVRNSRVVAVMVALCDHRHRLRRDGDARAEGHEAADRLLLGVAPRVRHARASSRSTWPASRAASCR